MKKNKKYKLKLTLKQSLLLLVIIPFIGLLTILISQIISENDNLRTMERQGINAEFTFDNINLISLMQKERGLSATLINGGDTSRDLSSIRSEVDNLYSKLINEFTIVSFYENNKDDLNKIKSLTENMRKNVDNKNIKFTDVMEGYSNIVAILINLNVISSGQKTAGGIGKRLTSLNIIIDAQEAAGRFRGYTSSILAANIPINLETMNTILLDFNTIGLNINSKGVLLTKESISIRNEFLNSKEMTYITEIFYTINNNYEIGNYNENSKELWDNATSLMSYIDQIIDLQVQEIENLNNGLLKNIQLQLLFNIIITIITTLLILTISVIVIRYISLRISKVTNRLIEMSAGGGDLTLRLDSDINDEIGKLSESFNSYILSLSTLISEIKNLGINFVTFSNELKKRITDVNNSRSTVSEALLDVDKNIASEKTSMTSMKSSMDSVEVSSNTLANSVEEQATAVEQSSAAVEQMLANINTVSQNVSRTSNIVMDLSTAGTEGKTQLNRVTQEINTVSELSNSLKNANILIADIADRTSLLSMNAAIEAAHAGDAGKGFAVVADEIRKLSESTTSQSKGITENLNLILSAISTAVTSSLETEATFSSITSKIENVSQNQEQIKNAMIEQNQGSSEILEAVTMLKENSESVELAVSDLKNAGHQMLKEEKEVFSILKSVETSVESMNMAVNDIESLLQTLTNDEKENSKLVNRLSENMDLFKLS